MIPYAGEYNSVSLLRQIGGIGLGIQIARAYGLPVCNLALEGVQTKFSVI